MLLAGTFDGQAYIKHILELKKMNTEKAPATGEEVKSAPLMKFPNLKAIREAHELTIDEVYLKTRISITNLDAIENGEFHLLPAPVYAKKFIDTYAKAIGIDAGNILAHYQRYLDEIQAVPEEDRVVVKAKITFDRKPSRRYPLYIAFAVAIIAAAVAMYAYYYEEDILAIFQQHAPVAEQKVAAPKPAPAVVEPPPAVVAPIIVPEVTTPPPSPPQLSLLIEATENTWLNITEDRNPPYQMILKKGDKLSRTAQEFFIIDVGNAAGANVTFNGKSLGSLGRKGQVVHIRLPEQ